MSSSHYLTSRKRRPEMPPPTFLPKKKEEISVTNPLPVFDGHNDTLLHLYYADRGGGRSFFTRAEKGHIDLPRAREGGFAGGFFAVWVPPDPAARRPSLHPEANGAEGADEGAELSAAAVPQTFALRMAMSLTATLFRL